MPAARRNRYRNDEHTTGRAITKFRFSRIKHFAHYGEATPTRAELQLAWHIREEGTGDLCEYTCYQDEVLILSSRSQLVRIIIEESLEQVGALRNRYLRALH